MDRYYYSKQLKEDCKTLHEDGETVKAIEKLRAATGCTLKAAIDFVKNGQVNGADYEFVLEGDAFCWSEVQDLSLVTFGSVVKLNGGGIHLYLPDTIISLNLDYHYKSKPIDTRGVKCQILQFEAIDGNATSWLKLVQTIVEAVDKEGGT